MVDSWVKQYNVHFKVVSPRKTKLGDCRFPVRGNSQTIITINQDLKAFQFLVTTVHELAHAKTFQEFRNKVAPHGKEWKLNFSNMLQELITRQDIPEQEKAILHSIAKNPKSTSYGNVDLQKYTKDSNVHFLRDLQNGSIFNFNKRDFRKIKLLRTYVLCECMTSQRKYKIHGLAEIKPEETRD